MDSFVALDVETANESVSSICAIGVALFDGGVLTDQHYTLVDPGPDASFTNSWLHSITETDVLGAPSFEDAMEDVLAFIAGRPVVTHSGFDRSAIDAACFELGREMPQLEWLDTVLIGRRAWPELRGGIGHGLRPLCSFLGIDQGEHHHALQDAIACGHILTAASLHLGLGLAELAELARQPITPQVKLKKIAGSGVGPLAAHSIVFTGALSLARKHAAELAAKAGATVLPNVGKNVTLLVVGEADIAAPSSSKHLKALAMIADGHGLRIIGEAEFVALCGA
ncbi:exonuclease domain-containing protein [Rhodovarius lipocyclicus]|uniref:exonuclease domain-containing protein n=1 Tax=Rhodovarius lipocyclicus TaxID=268410 RepID=UPI0013589932|nr:exonuclease domain-containing protein [Rhodovarius lipocyclicus]